MDKEILIRNFSRYAHSYDHYADVQKVAALRLLEEIKDKSFEKILEIGCGTGNYTYFLKERFKDAELKVIDISEKMIEVASKKLNCKGIEFVVADAEKIQLDEDFDLITSNACFQWFEYLGDTVMKYSGALKKNGIILFSLFGPLTFWELGESFKSHLKDVKIESANFLTKEMIEEILHKNFKDVKIKEARYKEIFPNLCELLRTIKYTGTRGEGLRKTYFGPSFLHSVERLYVDRFKKIEATYQVFFCLGQK